MDLTATAVAAAGGPVEGSLPLDGRDLAPVIASGGYGASDHFAPALAAGADAVAVADALHFEKATVADLRTALEAAA